MAWMNCSIGGHTERRGYHLIADRFACNACSECVGQAGSALRAAIDCPDILESEIALRSELRS